MNIFIIFLLFSGSALCDITGRATSYVALYPKPFHIKKEFIYVKQPDTPWVSAASGKRIIRKYKIKTGDLVSVNTTRRRQLSAPLKDVVTFTVLQQAPNSKEIFTGSPININSIAYIISMKSCGFPAPITPDGLRKIWFNNNTYPNMKDYFSTCTYNKIVFSEKNNIILGPIDVPCIGNYTRGSLVFPYNSSRLCTSTEQYSWVTYAEEWSKNNGYNWTNINQRRIIMILPGATKCAWAGLSPVGCYKSCALYIKGAYAQDFGVVFHELGHSIGLMHASKGTNEYGDASDAMGDDGIKANGYICMNAPNMYHVGWSSYIGNLQENQVNNAKTNTNIPMVWKIPPTSQSDKAFLKINNYYVSMRRKVAKRYDGGLANAFNNKVFVHQYKGDQIERDFNMSSLITYMTVNGTWKSPSGIRIDVQKILTDGALVRVCWMTATNETGLDLCSNGLDDDCDGLIDNADPSCQGK